MTLLSRFAALALWAAAFVACANQPVSFTNDIAPILVQKCLTCHGAEKNKGGFRLDTYDSLGSFALLTLAITIQA